ncbi:hypothetical protein [Lactiplantibacillus paraxiangfangensis]|uniref:hypothetical protein n=1 Tax=Lactiplantibacillus paraxiangfangensis TaxID=3076224 RepID=UPI0030C734C4
MASVIIPGLGMVADAGLSGINCFLGHVSTIIIVKPFGNFKFLDGFYFLKISN